MNNQYKFDKKFDDAGFSLYKEVGFKDSQKAHNAFWMKYERPPLEEYWDYIINRRDLLVPQDIRESGNICTISYKNISGNKRMYYSGIFNI